MEIAILNQADEKRRIDKYQLDNTSCMETEGVEILGPYTGTYCEQLGVVRLVIGGRYNSNIIFNELNAPAYLSNSPNVGNEFRDGNVCLNLGKGMLAGSPADGACLKVGPGENLEAAVTPAKTTNGGSASISTPMIVRLHVIEVKGETEACRGPDSLWPPGQRSD
ncbi:MAG: hypothetical protein ACE14P_12740 [Methanotrichaceae archaeon]